MSSWFEHHTLSTQPRRQSRNRKHKQYRPQSVYCFFFFSDTLFNKRENIAKLQPKALSGHMQASNRVIYQVLATVCDFIGPFSTPQRTDGFATALSSVLGQASLRGSSTGAHPVSLSKPWPLRKRLAKGWLFLQSCSRPGLLGI